MAKKTEFLSKEEKYDNITQKLDKLYSPSLSRCANICQVLSVLKYDMQLFWVGIYEMVDKNTLKLDAFQGEIACTEIKIGEGACGTAAKNQEVVNLKDVNQIENYIACHQETMSEIVIPGIHNGETLFVLDIDSEKPAYFESIDEKYLQQITEHLVKIFVDYGRN